MGRAQKFGVSSLAAIQSMGKWRLASFHAEDVPVLYAITRGQGRVLVAGRTRGLNPPSYLFVPQRTAVRFDFAGPIYGTKLRFDPSAVPELPSEPILLRGLPAQTQALISQHLSRIEEERNADDLGADRAIVAHASLLAVTLARAHHAMGAPVWADTKSRVLVSRFMALVEADLAAGDLDGPSVAEFAQRLDITPTHLSRVCVAEIAQGASSYLQDRLLSEARRRLKETAAPVQEIARDLGYRSAAYFTRAYGARMGHTPSSARHDAAERGLLDRR